MLKLLLFLEEDCPGILKGGWFACQFRNLRTIIKEAIMWMIIGIYELVSFAYNIFRCLASTSGFGDNFYKDIINNVYAILGVIVLFVMAYNFLLYIIDPEKNSGETSVKNILKNVITTLILIAVLPTIFSFASNAISSFLANNVIHQIIFGDEGNVAHPARTMAINTFTAFFDVSDKSSNTINVNKDGTYTNAVDTHTLSKHANGACFPNGEYDTDDDGVDDLKIKNNTYEGENGKKGSNPGCQFGTAKKFAIETGVWNSIVVFARNLVDGDMEWNFLPCLVAGVYLAYVFIIYAFQMAIRSIKLVFYQIVSPLCCACRILPSKKDIFTRWKSAIIKEYTSVFVRIFAVEIGLLLITKIYDILGTVLKGATGCQYCGVFLFIFLMLGIITFIKTCPKLIDDLIGEGDSGLGKSIKDSFKDSFDPALKYGRKKMAGTAAQAAALGRGIRKARQIKKAEADKVKEAERKFKKVQNLHNAKSTATAKKNLEAAQKAARRANLSASILAATGAIKARCQGETAGEKANNLRDAIHASGQAAGKIIMGNQKVMDDQARYKAEGKGYIAGKIGDFGAETKDFLTASVDATEAIIKAGQIMSELQDKMLEHAKSLMNKPENSINKDLLKYNNLMHGTFKDLPSELQNMLKSFFSVDASGNMVSNRSLESLRIEASQQFNPEGNIPVSLADVGELDRYIDHLASISADPTHFDRVAARASITEIPASYVANAQTKFNDYQANLKVVVSNIEKQVASDLVDHSNDSSYCGIKNEKFADIRSDKEEIKANYESRGSTVTGQDGVTYGALDSNPTAKAIDDITKAFKSNASKASADSAVQRLKENARKGNKNE